MFNKTLWSCGDKFLSWENMFLWKSTSCYDFCIVQAHSLNTYKLFWYMLILITQKLPNLPNKSFIMSLPAAGHVALPSKTILKLPVAFIVVCARSQYLESFANCHITSLVMFWPVVENSSTNTLKKNIYIYILSTLLRLYGNMKAISCKNIRVTFCNTPLPKHI